MKHYRSSISKSAWERVIARHPKNGAKRKAEYVLNRKIVGTRDFAENGEVLLEIPLKNGVRHGVMYYFDTDALGNMIVTFAEPYENGLAHGIARQWSLEDGKLVGTYSMRHGTGLDLWRNWNYDKQCHYLSEVRYLKKGNWHGFEWWLNEDEKTVWLESHFWENLQHGIRREWNPRGALRRGFPQYFVKNERVSKPQYIQASADDPTLPHFRESDNRPYRKFPSQVLKAMSNPATSRRSVIPNP